MNFFLKKNLNIILLGIFIIINFYLNSYYSFIVEPYSLRGDETQYLSLGISIVTRGSYAPVISDMYIEIDKPTAFRVPIYPVFLATIIKLLGFENIIYKVRFIQIILNIIIILLIYYLAFILFEDKRISLISALLGTFYQPFIFLSSFLTSDLLAIFLLLCSIISGLFIFKSKSYKKLYFYAFITGFFIAIASLCRPNNFILIFCFIFVFINGFYSKKQIFKGFLILFVTVFSILSIWGVRNYYKIGKFIFLSSYIGTAIYKSNTLDLSPTGGTGGALPLIPSEINTNQISRDKYMLDLGIKLITNNKKLFLIKGFLKLKTFFSPHLKQEHTSKTGYYLLLIFPFGFFFSKRKILYIILSLILYWAGIYLYSYPDYFSIFQFIFTNVTFGFEQIYIFSLFSLFIFIKEIKKYKIVLSPIIILIMLFIVIAFITVPKMRLRFAIDPFFIIFAAYGINLIYIKTFKSKKDTTPVNLSYDN